MGKFVHACRALWSYKVQDALGWLCICLNAGVSIKSWNPNSTHRFITQITLSSETGNSLISLPTYGILSSSCVKPFITSNTDSVTYSDPIIFWPFYFIITMTISLPVFDLLVLSLVIYSVYPSPAPSLPFIPCTQKYLTAWRKKNTFLCFYKLSYSYADWFNSKFMFVENKWISPVLNLLHSTQTLPVILEFKV